jgi:hypothetical protein
MPQRQGNGLYGDRYGNRMQIVEPPQPQRPSGNPYYDRLIDNQSRQCRDFSEPLSVILLKSPFWQECARSCPCEGYEGLRVA